MKKLIALVAVAFLAALPAIAGEWHTGSTNLCTDCHTMHFSQTHQWGSDLPIGTTPAGDGNWLSTSGPNAFLLKAPANQLCLACHDGQSFAPDVLATDFNAGVNRGAGALNETGVALAGYEEWKGHTLGTTNRPPGYDPTATPAGDVFPAGTQLECTSCHTQHGLATVYRNLGPRALGTANLPKYVINTTNDVTKDVWVNIAPVGPPEEGGYIANTGDAATFNPFYSANNLLYNRIDKTVGTAKTSNGIDTMCAACHGNFHGGQGDPGIGGDPVADGGERFLRHPTAQEPLNAGAHGTSALSRYVGATTKVKVYTTNYTGYTDASPGCVSCHKAHGNQNPFGLVFLSRNATGGVITEEGGRGATDPPESANGYQVGYRNLCGQCHGQGN
jgi:cytochrome c553